MKRLNAVRVALFLALAAGPVGASPLQQPPADLKPAPALTPRPDEIVSDVPITAYLLALNWTPEWCRSGGSGATAAEMECGRPFGFSLHGLWPNGAHPPYPAYCKPVGALEPALVREMWPRTPSAVLLQHEWQKHGPCADWPNARAYFADAARLYDRIAIPRIEAIAPADVTVGRVRQAFADANPWLPADTIAVTTTREHVLAEVRVCYDLKLAPTACAPGGPSDSQAITLAPSLNRSF